VYALKVLVIYDSLWKVEASFLSVSWTILDGISCVTLRCYYRYRMLHRTIFFAVQQEYPSCALSYKVFFDLVLCSAPCFGQRDSCFVDRLLGVNPSLDGKLKCALSGTYVLDAYMGGQVNLFPIGGGALV